MTVINTNTNALAARNAINANTRTLQTAMQQLATGSKINNASDDAAGLAIRENMTAQIKGFNAAIRNANDGISLLQTADAAMDGMSSMLQRMRELSVLAQNDTYSSAQLTAMDDEFQALLTEVDRLASDTQFNGFALLNGDGGNLGGTSVFSFQVGANSSQTIEVTISDQGTGGALSAIASATVASATSAASAVTNLDTAIQALAANRSVIGAAINRLTYSADNATTMAQNAASARSQISDTDYATATSELARAQIIQQAGTAMLAQANQQPQTVLALLR
jgi:flagellin